MLTDFQTSFTDRFTSKFATKPWLIISPHLNCVTTLLVKYQSSKNAMIKTWVYEATCYAKFSHSEQLLKFLTVILALFSSLTKKIDRVAILKFPQYDCTHLLRRRRKDIAAICFCIWYKWSVSHFLLVTSPNVHIFLKLFHQQTQQ